MAEYHYKARDKSGKPVSGAMSAFNQKAVAAKLKSLGYVPVYIKETAHLPLVGGFFRKFSRISLADKNMFTRQLSALQRAGVQILLSLESLKQEIGNKKMKQVVSEVIGEVESGNSFSAALEKHPDIFGPLYVNMVRTGEASGKLDQALDKLAQLGEYEEKVQRRIKAAVRYPIMVVAALIIGFIILVTVVIPRFVKVYSNFTMDLPLPTRVLIWLNLAVTKYWWAVLAAGVILVYVFNRIINTSKGRLWWDSLKLKVPVFGPLTIKIIMSRFSRIVGNLMHSGVPLFEVLDLASGGVGNVVVTKAINNIKKSVSEGKGISEPMKSSRLFTPTVVQMVAVGEKTGRLDELLLHVSGYYDAQVEYTVDDLASLVEPALIMALGSLVLIMALGIFLPMWNLIILFKR